jgi:hypothetical protein
MDKKKIYSAVRFFMIMIMVYFFTTALIAAFSPSLLPKNMLYINFAVACASFVLIILMLLFGFDLRINNTILSDERDLESYKMAVFYSYYLTMGFTLLLVMMTAFKIVELSAFQSLILVIIFGATSRELLRFYSRRTGKI